MSDIEHAEALAVIRGLPEAQRSPLGVLFALALRGVRPPKGQAWSLTAAADLLSAATQAGDSK